LNALVAVPEPTAKRRVRSAAFARAGVVTLVVIGLDQLTKHTIAASIRPGESRKFLPAIDLVHVRNPGVAFGFLSGGGAVVLIFTLVALAVLLGFFALRPGRRWLWVPTGMILWVGLVKLFVIFVLL
jgi:signal peptidase II